MMVLAELKLRPQTFNLSQAGCTRHHRVFEEYTNCHGVANDIPTFEGKHMSCRFINNSPHGNGRESPINRVLDGSTYPG